MRYINTISIARWRDHRWASMFYSVPAHSRVPSKNTTLNMQDNNNKYISSIRLLTPSRCARSYVMRVVSGLGMKGGRLAVRLGN